MVNTPKNPSAPIMSFSYVLGMIMSDGGFLIRIFPKPEKPLWPWVFKPSFNITQTVSTPANTLFFESLENTFASWGMSWKYENMPKKEVRRIVVEGEKNMTIFLKKIRQNSVFTINGKVMIPFTGKKLRDFLIVQKLEKLRPEPVRNRVGKERLFIYSPEGALGILMLRYNMHCKNATEQLKKTGNRKSYQEAGKYYFKDKFDEYQNKYSSQGQFWLNEIDKEIAIHEAKLSKAMVDGTLRVDPDYITGFCEGDGSLKAGIVTSPDVRFRVFLQVVASETNKLILNVVEYFFKSFYWGSNEVNKSLNYIHLKKEAGIEMIAGQPTIRNENVYALRISSWAFFDLVLWPWYEKCPYFTAKAEGVLVIKEISDQRKCGKLSFTDFKRLVTRLYDAWTTKSGLFNKKDITVVMYEISATFERKANLLAAPVNELLVDLVDDTIDNQEDLSDSQDILNEGWYYDDFDD